MSAVGSFFPFFPLSFFPFPLPSLPSQVPHYEYALELLLDADAADEAGVDLGGGDQGDGVGAEEQGELGGGEAEAEDEDGRGAGEVGEEGAAPGTEPPTFQGYRAPLPK